MEKKNSKVNLNCIIEVLCKIFCFLFLGFFIVNFKYLTDFSIEREYYYPLKDAFKTLLGLLYSFLTFKFGVWFVKRFFEDSIKDDRKPGETKEDVLQRLGNHIGAIVFYTTTFVTMFTHYRGTEFCPTILGGSLNLANHPLEVP